MTMTARWLIAIVLLLYLSDLRAAESDNRLGPLVRHSTNPRYFAGPAGKAVLLTGSHTWANFQERGEAGSTPDFDYDQYLTFLSQHGHNFMRIWAWEQAQWMQFKPATVPVRYAPLLSSVPVPAPPWTANRNLT